MNMNYYKLLLLSFALGLITACGGGGTPPSPPPPPNQLPTGFLSASNALVGNQFVGKVALPVKFDVSSYADPDGTLVSFKYQFGDGTSVTKTTNEVVTHVYTTAGVYSPSVTVIDNSGDAIIGSLLITIGTTNIAPQPKFAVVSTDLTTGKYIEFDPALSQDYDGTISTFTWDFGDGCTICTAAGSGNPRHYFEVAGTYTVKLTVVDNSGASTAITKTVKITGAPYVNQVPVGRIVADYDLYGGPVIGYPVVFYPTGSYDPDGTIVSYKWELDDGSAPIIKSTPTPVTATYLNTANRTVKLTVTDDRGSTHVWPFGFNVLASLTPVTYTSRINDTHSVLCVDSINPSSYVACNIFSPLAFSGKLQDGMIGRDQDSNDPADGIKGLSYSRICNSGQAAGSGTCPMLPVLGSGLNDWGCTKDNVTGLMWEIKTADNGPRDYRTLHFMDPLSEYAKLSGILGVSFSVDANGNWFSSAKLVSKYVQDANATTSALCGYTDWRIPIAEELDGLFVYNPSTTTSSVDNTFFPNTRFGGAFWASTLTQLPDLSGITGTSITLYGPDTSARLVGYNGRFSDTSPYYPLLYKTLQIIRPRSVKSDIRLVRSTFPAYEVRFKERSFGTEPGMLDKESNLLWRMCPEGMTWNTSTRVCNGQAIKYTFTEALAFAKTQPGWRMPNKNELASIRTRTIDDPTLIGPPFSAGNLTAGDLFWSSTPFEDGGFLQTNLLGYSYRFDLGLFTLDTLQRPAAIRLVRDWP
jgi:PKD repeat protein